MWQHEASLAETVIVLVRRIGPTVLLPGHYACSVGEFLHCPPSPQKDAEAIVVVERVATKLQLVAVDDWRGAGARPARPPCVSGVVVDAREV